MDPRSGLFYAALKDENHDASASPRVRLRMHRSSSRRTTANAKSSASRRLFHDVQKAMRFTNIRDAFKQNAQLAARIALGVLVAGVAQTRSTGHSNKQWALLPADYFLGGLSWAALMVIFAAARTVGGAIMQIWQIDLGVALALLYNVVVYSLIPMQQHHIVTVSVNLNGNSYDISLTDWAKIVPLLLLFTFIVFVLPIETNIKKFAVSNNLYFMLTIMSPMNPIYPMQRKDLGDGYFNVANLIHNFAIYSLVGVVGTLISLATMLFPFPIFAIREFKGHVRDTTQEIKELLNLIVDTYCFRVKDVRRMDFFRLRLERGMASLRRRHTEMEELLVDCWWEELIGIGWFFQFNKTVSKQFIHLVASLINNLDAMTFAIELETCHSAHATLMRRIQRKVYVLQTETNDLLDEIATHVLDAATTMPTEKLRQLECRLEHLIQTYTETYSSLLTTEIRTPQQVGRSMPLNLFLYSFHALIQTLVEFENTFNHKNFSLRHRVSSFIRHVMRSLWQKEQYPRQLLVFALRTTFAVFIGVCLSTFVFAFSSTVPNAIAMVAEAHIGGTYGNTANRLSGLVAGTVLPSIFSFFICKSRSAEVYNTVNNIVLFAWTTLSMYVFYSSRYFQSAGMVSAYMAASVLLEHSCRSQNGNKALSYSSLTENSLGILILMLTELLVQPKSARTLLRANVAHFLQRYKTAFLQIYGHHLAAERGNDLANSSAGDRLLDPTEIASLRKLLDVDLPLSLKTQEQLLQDASLEPDLWRSVFEQDKHASALGVCRTLLKHLRVLLDLASWHHARRQSSVSMTAPRGANEAAVKATSTNTLHQWHQSQDNLETSMTEALDTLIALFGDQLACFDPDETAIFMQMKEAFRVADVHRRGQVDATELAVLLEQLMPYSIPEGAIKMDQYVAEFMRLVDRNRDGIITYAEFMDALHHGFRLELEIYNDIHVKSAVFRQSSRDVDNILTPDSTGDEEQAQTENEEESGGKCYRSASASHDSALKNLWANATRLMTTGIWGSTERSPSPQRPSFTLPIGHRDTLLAVESFSIHDAASALRDRYGQYLLHETAARHIPVEDFILMSCLVCSVEEIASQLLLLNRLAAT
ncbi:hypothetical protein PINS_up010367 [Pythium insidiosum]|nr:hypothetical protein PINS_up010367 [Pythium insidiosum]